MSGHMNVLFASNAEQEDGCLEYFLSLMKALSQRLTSANAMYMLGDDDFYMLRKAIALTTHRDVMVRTSTRTSYLTLLRLPERGMQKVCVPIVKGMLLRPLGALLRSQWAALVEAARQENRAAFRQAAYDEEEPCVVRVLAAVSFFFPLLDIESIKFTFSIFPCLCERQETFAHLAELLLLGEPEIAEAVAQLLGRELLQGQLPQLRKILVPSDVFETQTEIVPSPGMSPASSPMPPASPGVERVPSDVVVTAHFSSMSLPPMPGAAVPSTEASPFDRAMAARAVAAFARAMGDADMMGVVMPVLELLLLPSAPSTLVDALAHADVPTKDVAAFVEQLAATAMEDVALKKWGNEDRQKYWQDQLRLAPGLCSGAGLVRNPFRHSILSMLEGTVALPFLATVPNDIFMLKSVTDPNVAACLAITEIQKIYPNLLVDAGLVYSPAPAVLETVVEKEMEDAGSFLRGLPDLSWLFNASKVSGQCF